jgi:hypothetical protein
MKMIYTKPTRIQASTVIHDVPCFLMKIVIGSDGTNNPVVAAYNEEDNSATAGKEILPSQTYDAVALGMNGVVYQFAEYCDAGLYIEITNLGTGSVVVSSRTQASMAKLNFA